MSAWRARATGRSRRDASASAPLWMWLLLQALAGAGALLLPPFAALVVLASVPLVALYPFMLEIWKVAPRQ